MNDKTPTDIFKRGLWSFIICVGLASCIVSGSKSSAETIRLCKGGYKAEIIYYAPIGQQNVLWKGDEVLRNIIPGPYYCKVDRVIIAAHSATGIDHDIAKSTAQSYLNAILRDLLDLGIDPAIVESKYVGPHEPMIIPENSTTYIPENSRIEIMVTYKMHIPKHKIYD